MVALSEPSASLPMTPRCVVRSTRWREGWAIQRDLDRLERWARANLMKVNKAKYKVLYIRWGNLKHKYRLSNEWIESSPEKTDWGDTGG